MTNNIADETARTSQSDSGKYRLSTWSELNVHTYIKIGIIGLLFYYLFANELARIVPRWFSDPSWSHGILIPLFSLYFLNQKKEEILNLQPQPSYLGLGLLIFGILFYFFDIAYLRYGYLQPLTMIGTLGAVVLFLGGWKLLKYTWLPVAFLIFAVPLPQRYYVSITMPMRKLAATVAGALLGSVNEIETTVNGVVIDVFYNGQPVEPALNVADACSGMRLLMAFLALGVAMAYLHKRPIWQRLILLASTIPIAVFCNIVRVTVTGFIYVLAAPKYAQGIYHDALGFAMLPLAFGLYSLLAWFMENLFVDEQEQAQPEEEIIVPNRNKQQSD